MPALGMTQDTGEILFWHKSVGDAVAADDVLMDVETDKSTMEMEAGFDGYVAEIRVPAGTTIAVGEVIAVLTSETQGSASAAPTCVSVNATTRENDRASALVPNSIRRATASVPRSRQVVSDAARVLSSPKARLLAHQHGVRLEQLVQRGIEQPLQSIDIENHVANPGIELDSTSVLQARIDRSAFDAFVNWASEESQERLTMAHVWSLFATGAFRQAWQSDTATELVVCAETWIDRQGDLTSINADLGGLYDIVTAETGAVPDLRLRILDGTALVNYQPAVPDQQPVLTIADSGDSLLLSLSFVEERVDLGTAQTFLTILGDCILQPLRHLL